MPQHSFRQGHHIPVVGVGLVELQHRKLRIVLGGNPLVAEIPVDLVNAVEASHGEPFQVKLRGDAQVKVEVQSVVVGNEGPCHGAACQRLHHGGFHLEVAFAFKKFPQSANQPAAALKNPPGFLIHHEVQVALAVADSPGR